MTFPKRKQRISVMLAVILLLAAAVPIHADSHVYPDGDVSVSSPASMQAPAPPASSGTAGWKNAYREILNQAAVTAASDENHSLDYAYYFLYDVDENSIPELFLYDGDYITASGYVALYTYLNGTAINCGNAAGTPVYYGLYGLLNAPGILFTYAKQGGWTISVLYLNGTSLEFTELNRGFSYTDPYPDVLYEFREPLHYSLKDYSGLNWTENPGFDNMALYNRYFGIEETQSEGTGTSFHVTVYDTGTEGLALKAQPNIDSQRYLYVYENTALTIDSVTADGWGHTTYNGYSGWVYLHYTKIAGNYEAEPPAWGAVSPTYYVVYDTFYEGLELRTGPDSAFSTFGPMYDGTRVRVEAIQDTWAYVSLNGRYGWTNLGWLKPAADQSTSDAVYDQAVDLVRRYNEMGKHAGCASMYLEDCPEDFAESLGLFDLETGNVRMYAVSRVVDCHTIEEAIRQRQEYFSDSVRGSDDYFVQFLKEYNGNLYVGWMAVDLNLFHPDTLAIVSSDAANVVATCVRELGGDDIQYELGFSWFNGHLKLTSMERCLSP